MKRYISILFGMLLIMPGCSHINVADYSGFANIPPEGMARDWAFEFSPFVDDSTLSTSVPYDVVIAVRYTNNCPSGSVVFNIEEFSLHHEHPDSSTVRLQLFDDDGFPVGRIRYGINEVSDTIRRGYRIPEGYTLTLSSPLPTDATAGIRSVGLVLSDPSKPQLKLW